MKAGVTCSGPGAHLQRQWCERPGRRITWRDGDGAHAIEVPVPGTAAVMTFDAFRLCVLLDSGEAWRFDTRDVPMWRPVAPTVKETGEMAKATKGAPALMWACPDSVDGLTTRLESPSPSRTLLG